MGQPEFSLEEVLSISQDRGFIGPGSFLPHVEHARAIRRLIPENARHILDLGSGGGLPGLVLALEDDADWVLLDAMGKRCDFLNEAIEMLGIADRVTVVWSRAEVAARQPELRDSFDLVVSRSFGAPAVTAECATGFLADGGFLIVTEPPEGDVRWPAGEMAKLGLTEDSRVVEPRAVRFVKAGSTPKLYPRPDGTPSKKPLW